MRLFLLLHHRCDSKTLVVFFKHNLVGIEKAILSDYAVDTEVWHESTRNGKRFCCSLQTYGDLMFIGFIWLITDTLILMWGSCREIYAKERGELGVENNI